MNAQTTKLFATLLLIMSFSSTAERLVTVDGPVIEVLIGPADPVPAKEAISKLNNPFAVEFTANGEMVVVENDGGRIRSWREGQCLIPFPNTQNLASHVMTSPILLP